MITVCGIDPGYVNLGYAIITKETPESKWKATNQTFVKAAQPNIGDKLLHIYTQLGRLLDEHKPDVVSIELPVFMGRGETGALVTQALGIIRLVTTQRNIPMYCYAAKAVKYEVTGTGQADKQAVQKKVKELFGLDIIPKPDHVADALAIAYCYVSKNNL